MNLCKTEVPEERNQLNNSNRLLSASRLLRRPMSDINNQVSNLPKALQAQSYLPSIASPDYTNQKKLDVVHKYKDGVLINHMDKHAKFEVP